MSSLFSDHRSTSVDAGMEIDGEEVFRLKVVLSSGEHIKSTVEKMLYLMQDRV